MNPWIAFAIGVLVGSFLGISIMCLMNASSEADKRMMPKQEDDT